MTKRDRNLSHATAEAYLEAARAHFSAKRFDIGVLRICRALDVVRNPSPGLVQQIQRAFDDFLTNVAPAAPLLEVVQMFELYRSRLGGDGKLLASATAPFVQKAGTQEQWELQRRLLICQADWTSQIGQQTDAEALYREAAETHFRRAEECKTWKTPNGFVVADHLARAVEAHRRINRKSSRADQLENEEKEIRRKAVEALRQQGGPPASLADAYRRLQESKTEMWGSAATQAAKAAQGLPLYEIIRFLALAHPPPHKAEFETLAKRELQTSVWKSLLPETLLDEDGNPFAKAGSYLHENPEGQQKVIEQRMFQHFKSEHVPGAVIVFEAVREQILQDYNLLPDHLVPIVQHSPFIPPGRELLFARGLLAGFNGDFILAAHLLTPQLEDALRAALQNNRVITTVVEKGGTKKQADLNHLFRHKRQQIEGLMGVDEAFELEALLIRRWGCNLRNDISHGRLWPSQLVDAPTRYLWWLTLRLCMFGISPLGKPWNAVTTH